MKWQAVVILFTIAVSIAVPLSLSLTVVRDKEAAIGVLDVCHSAAPALFSNGDMPGVNVRSYCPLPLALQEVTQIVSFQGKPFLIASQDERPPQLLA